MWGRAPGAVFWCAEVSLLAAALLLSRFCSRRRFRPSLAIVGSSEAGKTRLFYALRDGRAPTAVRSVQESRFSGYLTLIGSEAEIRDIPSCRLPDLELRDLGRASVVLVCLGRDSYCDSFAFLLKLARAGRPAAVVGGPDFLDRAMREFWEYADAEAFRVPQGGPCPRADFTLLRAELGGDQEAWEAEEVYRHLYREL